ncbi:MAG: hypothetical protein J6B50_05730 [Lachnospiraceae bacterium]|nr:hypothetical protein [Lachnospiraceae bacterium]MBP3507586.1 hypothetical protein [Lachnospiraceae bacterium]
MTVGEARQAYSMQLKSYNIQKCKLAQQKSDLDMKIKTTENGSVVFANEAAALELTYNAVAEKQNEYQNYMDQLMEQWDTKFNEIATQQKVEAEKEGFEDLARIMTVARRLMHGDIVPQSDEKKLMEYDSDLYQMAKNAQMMAQIREKDRKKHESLWEDEEKKEQVDAMEEAEGQEAFAAGPEIVAVEDTMAAAVASMEGTATE